MQYLCSIMHYRSIWKSNRSASRKKALAIICPSIAYNDALDFRGILKITTYNEAICDKMFDVAIVKDSDNRLNKLSLYLFM